MKLILTFFCLINFATNALSQIIPDSSKNQSIISLLFLQKISDIQIKLPEQKTNWLIVDKTNQRLQKNRKTVQRRRKQILSLTHDIGILAKVSKTSSISFYSAMLATPTSTFVPLDGTDFFSDIQAITPEDDADIRFGYKKIGRKFDAGINIFSKSVEDPNTSLLETQEYQDTEFDLDQDEADDNSGGDPTYRQGIRFNTSYHLIQSQKHRFDINLELVIIQNNSTSQDNINGFDEDDLPSKTVKNGLLYQFDRLKFGFDAKFVSSTTSFTNAVMRSESIKVLDCEVGYDLSDRSTISFQCHNILNENRLSKGGYAVLRNPNLILNQARYFLVTYLYAF